MVGRHLPGRRQLVDDLRQRLREAGACVGMRQPELLRDLTDRARSENFLELTRGHGEIRARPDPGSDLIGEAAVLQLADDPGKPAVLLDQLQRRSDERALRLLRTPAEHAAQYSIEKTHTHLRNDEDEF